MSGKGDLQSLLQSLFRSSEFASKQREFLQHYIKPELRNLFFDHSQNGEFGYIARFLMERAQTNKIIVDVGARGRERSNSFDLLRHLGWRGLLIEANPSLLESIRADFAGTDFFLEFCAVSDYEGRAEFYFGVNDDVSSLSQHAAEGWGDIRGKTAVEVHKLATLLSKHSIPSDFDILSLDIEGEDIRALNALIAESSFRPRLVVIEVGAMPDPRDFRSSGLSVAVRRHYEYFAHCGPNLFLARI